MQTHTFNQMSLLLWRYATARTRRQNYRQKIRRVWTSDHSSSVQSNSPGTPSTLNTHVCSNTNNRLQSEYSVIQESVSDLATPVNLMRQFTGHKRIRLHTRRQLLSNCPSHSATHSVAASLECQHTRRLGVWACDCVYRGCVHIDHGVLAGWSILVSVVCRAFAPLRTANGVRNNRGYVIAKYVISSRRPMLKNRKIDGTVIVSTL